MTKTLCAGMVAGLCGSAMAQLHATDVLLRVESGRVVTGRDEGGTPMYPRFAFSAELGKVVPHASTEPGFDSEQGVFAQGTLVGISLRAALREWDGQDFDSVPDERMRVTKGLVSALTPLQDPGLCGAMDSVPLGLANSFGVLHEHPAYELLDPADPGAYLLELEGWTGGPGGGASRPFWIVFGEQTAPGAVDAAVGYVESVLACPADFNRDGALTVADFGAFQTGFVSGLARADMNGDCVLNVADFGAFQTAFVLRCP